MANEQRGTLAKKILPVLEANPNASITYFGLAPIPLMIHLGFLCQIFGVDARNRTHGDRSWEWQGRQQDDPSFRIICKGIPKRRITGLGKIVIVLETSFKVDEKDVAKIVPHPIKKIVIKSEVIHPNGIKSKSEMMVVVETFWNVLNQLSTFCDPDCEIHLFAGIPAGLSFMLGTRIHASSHHKIITYKFARDRKPFKHLRALTIGMHTPEPVRILFIASNPIGTEALDLEGEAKSMEHAIRSSWQASDIIMEVLLDASSSELVKKLISFQPTILHYAGHGSRNRNSPVSRDLFLQDDAGKPVARTGEELHELLVSLNLPVQLLVLNACHSSGMIEGFLPYVGCVVGMNDSIFDYDAIKFSEVFYSMLSTGSNVEEAFRGGRFSMNQGRKIPELRSGTLNASELRIVN